MGRKFKLGTLLMTRSVHEKFESDYEFMKFVMDSFAQYRRGDWGKLCKEDKAQNEKALKDGLRLMGSYDNGRYRIWFITEWDRSSTTILFPDEY